MQYELVNVTGVRGETFTAELIVPGEDGYAAIVGVYTDSEEGNFAPGIDIYTVSATDYVTTGQFIERVDSDRDGEPKYTPNLV